MPNEYDELLLLGYVEGDLTDAQRARVEQWISQDPRLGSLLAKLAADRDAVRAVPEPDTPAGLMDDVDRVLERSMLLQSAPAEQQERVDEKRFAMRRTIAIVVAAAMLLVVTAVVIQSIVGLGADPVAPRDLAMGGRPAPGESPTPSDTVDEAWTDRDAPPADGIAKAPGTLARSDHASGEPIAAVDHPLADAVALIDDDDALSYAFGGASPDARSGYFQNLPDESLDMDVSPVAAAAIAESGRSLVGHLVDPALAIEGTMATLDPQTLDNFDRLAEQVYNEAVVIQRNNTPSQPATVESKDVAMVIYSNNLSDSARQVEMVGNQYGVVLDAKDLEGQPQMLADLSGAGHGIGPATSLNADADRARLLIHRRETTTTTTQTQFFFQMQVDRVPEAINQLQRFESNGRVILAQHGPAEFGYQLDSVGALDVDKRDSKRTWRNENLLRNQRQWQAQLQPRAPWPSMVPDYEVILTLHLPGAGPAVPPEPQVVLPVIVQPHVPAFGDAAPTDEAESLKAGDAESPDPPTGGTADPNDP